MNVRLFAVILSTLAASLAPATAATLVSATFTTTDEQTIFVGPRIFGEFDFSITNLTSQVWTQFSIFDADPIGSIPIGLYSGPGSISGQGLSSNPFVIDGLNVGSGSTLEFSLTENCSGTVCSLGGTIWTGSPTGFGASVVPLPASLPLLAVALGGTMLLRRKRS